LCPTTSHEPSGGDGGAGAGGLSPAIVAKFDIEKLKKLKEWGWRFLAFDFIMPNTSSLSAASCSSRWISRRRKQNNEDPDAAACADFSNPGTFKKQRARRQS
jgi:hypothetical protein